MTDTYRQGIPALTEAQIDIAVLKTNMESMAREMSALQKDLIEVRDTLDEVKVLLSEAKGGWRMMMLLGGGGATLGGVVSWIANHVTFK